MFDSAPSNLPIEPAAAPPSNKLPEPNQGISNPGVKEPEDIFADISEEPGLAESIAEPVQNFRAPVSKGFPWRIVLGVGIPLLVLGLGLGGWYVYGSFLKADKSVKVPVAKEAVSNIPVTNAPDNTPSIPNPIAPPDEEKIAASQAAMTLMQLQAGKGYTGTDVTSSTLGIMDTSTIQNIINAQEGQSSQPPVAPPNVPLPEIAVNQGNAPAKLELGLDTDGDGLTNSEEALMGSDPNKQDTNDNGYPDLTEVINGYDPLIAGSRLLNSRFLKTELIGTLNVLIPKVWERKPGTGGTVQILTGTPAVILVELKPYATDATFLDWVEAENQGVFNRAYTAGKTKSGIDVVYSEDGMSAWLLAGNTVYVFRYNVNTALNKDFGKIFENILTKQASMSQI